MRLVAGLLGALLSLVVMERILYLNEIYGRFVIERQSDLYYLNNVCEVIDHSFIGKHANACDDIMSKLRVYVFHQSLRYVINDTILREFTFINVLGITTLIVFILFIGFVQSSIEKRNRTLPVTSFADRLKHE